MHMCIELFLPEKSQTSDKIELKCVVVELQRKGMREPVKRILLTLKSILHLLVNQDFSEISN